MLGFLPDSFSTSYLISTSPQSRLSYFLSSDRGRDANPYKKTSFIRLIDKSRSQYFSVLFHSYPGLMDEGLCAGVP